MSDRLPGALERWLDASAEDLDAGRADPESVVPELARHGLFGIGVAEAQGGSGGLPTDAVRALSALAERSLTAAFVSWGQRTFIEYLLVSPNEALRERWLAPLIAGNLAGATGLSNAIKFLSGIEELQVTATPRGRSFSVEGRAPWVTNLRKAGYLVAVAAHAAEASPLVLALPGDVAGMLRSDDFRLFGLGSSNTAALRFEGLELSSEYVLHPDARCFVAEVRPMFLGLQCALAIGLSRASLQSAREGAGARSTALVHRIELAAQRLSELVNELELGLADGRFVEEAPPLFAIRIELARVAQASVELELGASGGSAYLSDRDRGFARRWREAAFLPIVSPSVVQLEQELGRRAAVVAA